MPKTSGIRWMLFANEFSNEHYFWNSKEAIIVNHDSSQVGEPLYLSDKDTITVREAAATPKQRLITVGERRHIIVSRGFMKEV